jgi:hypothetical protein
MSSSRDETSGRSPQGAWSSAGRILRGRVAFAALLPLLLLYAWGALRQADHVNTDPKRSDQGAYLRIVERMHATGYRYLGDRNRMPLYPAIQALVAAPEADPEDVFARAKRVNILLSTLILIALVPILRAWLPWLQTLVVLLVTAFTVFLFKAGWVQAELLFYFLSFTVWLALIRLLLEPSWRLGLLAGVLAGLAYLTKASVLPTMVLWTLWSGLVVARELSRTSERARGLQRLASTGAALLMALVVVFPYLADNKRIYGRWFYNVNVNLYAWCDSWEEATWVKAHGAMEQWPALPADQIPSVGRYLETHTASQIGERLAKGSVVALRRAQRSYGYFYYLLVYGGLAAFLLWKNRSWTLDMVKRRWAVCGFLPLYFSISFLLVAWYVPIADGNRFILAHVLPLLFIFAYATAAAPPTSVGGRPVSRAAHLVILILLLADILLRLLPGTATIYGGR